MSSLAHARSCDIQLHKDIYQRRQNQFKLALPKSNISDLQRVAEYGLREFETIFTSKNKDTFGEAIKSEQIKYVIYSRGQEIYNSGFNPGTRSFDDTVAVLKDLNCE